MPSVRDAIKRLDGTRGHVAIAIWCREDVIERGREKGVVISQKRADAILDAVDHKQDCSYGITWETFDCYIDEFKTEHPHYRRCPVTEGD